MKQASIILIAAALLGSLACTTPIGTTSPQVRPDNPGGGLGPESQDLVTITDKMARGILGTEQIANAEGKPVVVLEPITNDTRFPIDKDIFLTRIRAVLNKNTKKIQFVAREHIEKLEAERDRKLAGQVTGGEKIKGNQFRGADFILTGTFKAISNRGKAGASDYILYTFQLINPYTSDIVWEDFYEIKKKGIDDITYR